MNYFNKNESYFINYISTQKERIERFKQLSNKCYDDSSKIRLNQTLFEMNKNMILAKCSLGYSKLALEENVIALLDNASVIETELPISDKIFILCIKYLFNKEILNAFQFLPKLKASLSRNKEEVYQGFAMVLNAENVQNSLKAFMNDKWYDLCVDFPWYGTENGDTFVGYWSFVAAAIAKAKLIKDDSIKFLPSNLL